MKSNRHWAIRRLLIPILAVTVCAAAWQALEEGFIPDWAAIPFTSLLVVPLFFAVGQAIDWPKAGVFVGVAFWLLCLVCYRINLGPLLTLRGAAVSKCMRQVVRRS